MRALDIQQVRLNGVNSTVFKIYEEENGVLVYQRSDSIKGSFKRESTVLRKYEEQKYSEF